MKCICCDKYFKESKAFPSNVCNECNEGIDEDMEVGYDYVSSLDQVEIETILNPTGKTPARFYD